MEQCEVIGNYILEKRKQCGYTQQQVADYLEVSCQAVSKWEKGISYPSIVVLKDLARILGVSVDEILAGKDKEVFDWEEVVRGFEVPRYHRLRRKVESYIQHEDERLLYAHSPYAALYEPDLEGIKEPVIAFMVNNLGSKLKMIIEYGEHEAAGRELANRLVNELLVKGAKPLMINHTVICGNIDGSTLEQLVKGFSEACKANDVTFAASEVCFHPDACSEKEYSMTAGIVGIVDKKRIIDGHKIKEGDRVIAIKGEGCINYAILHRILEKHPEVKRQYVNGQYFMEKVMKPSRCYYKALEEVMDKDYLHGIVHLRNDIAEPKYYEVVPKGLAVELNFGQIQIDPIYTQFMELWDIKRPRLMESFNFEVGMLVITDDDHYEEVMASIRKHEICYGIGKIIKGEQKVSIINE